MFKIFDFSQIDPDILKKVFELALRLGLFFILTIFSPFIGRFIPKILKYLLLLSNLWTKIDVKESYNESIKPFTNPIAVTGTLFCLSASLNLLVKYEELYQFLGFFIYLALSISIIWLASVTSRKVIRKLIINLVKRWFGEVNEIVLIFETLIYVIIVIIALIIFAQGLNLDLVALATGLGISGVAFAFASQHSLSRLFGTLELYLDRPFTPGEYIRVNFNPYAQDIYGRIESIGLRSTKIRIVAQNTLMIVPNSLMASKNIENISRGKKIMAMVSLDFQKFLKEDEKALVKQVVKEESLIFWSLDKASTNIQFSLLENSLTTRARIIFFFTGSSDNSINLRRRLLILANENIATKLASYNLLFSTPEPVLYIDSPMSI